MIGRAYLWGLAANGQAGVENVLDILRGGIDSALLGLGKSSIHDLDPADLVIPPGFTRELGCSGRCSRCRAVGLRGGRLVGTPQGRNDCSPYLAPGGQCVSTLTPAAPTTQPPRRERRRGPALARP